MTHFPAGFATITALDADDIFLLDGKRKATGAVVKRLALPTGFADAADHVATSGALIASADSTTNWTAVNANTAISTATSSKTEGTGALRAILKLTAGLTSKVYYTPPGTQSIAGRSLVAFDLTVFAEGPTHYATPEFEARVADGAALTAGNVNSVNLAGVPYGDTGTPNGAWVTVVLPLSGLSNITSIGLYRATTTTGGATDRIDFRIDNVRFIDETKLDVALASSTAVAAWVPPNYTPSASQVPLYIPTGKGLVDPAKGVYSKANNVVWLHDYLAHVVGAETGEADVSFAVGRIISQATAGQTIRATPGATYRFDHDIRISNDDTIIDFTGATIILTYKSNSAFFTLAGCTNVTIKGGTWLGYYGLSQTGSTLTNVAGTPTTVSTTKQLSTLDDEVKLPTHLNWSLGSHFARHLPQQLGLAADGLPPRCYWEFVLSDSAQVANDCVISVYDDTTSTLLTSSTLTLTSTPTTYRISYAPSDLRQRHKVTVRKATTTTNTITVTSANPYGENEYSATYDIASCILIAGSSYIKILDMWIEGFGGDAIQISDANVNHLEVSRCVSRACRRQGMSFNQGTDITIEDCVIGEPGRSGIDFEPFANTWFTRRVKCLNTTFYNTGNYGFAMGNWARNFDYVIDGVDMYATRLGVMFGGFTNGVLTNIRNWSDLNYGAAQDYDITGSAMQISNIRSKVKVTLHTTTNTFDDGGGVVTFTPTNNIVHSRTVIAVAGTGVAWVAGWRPDGLSDIAVTASATSHAVVFAGYTIPTTYNVNVETNWNSGHPYVTAKTSAGFTINFPTAAPGDGSGRISWGWTR